MNTLRQLLCALALLTAALVPLTSTASPQYVNYQGLLNGADGQPLPTGNYTIEFNIYNAASGGSLVWGPFRFDGTVGAGKGAVVPVVNGRFNVIIGPQDTASRNLLDAFAGSSDRYVEIKVNNGAPILPRQQFLTTPYAARATTLGAPGQAAAVTVSGTSVGIGTATPGGKLEINADFNQTPLLNLKQNQAGWGTVPIFNAFRYIRTEFPGVPADGPFRQFNVGGGGVSIGYPNVPTYGSADALYVNGNVGIGTTTPSVPLSLGTSLPANKLKLALYDAPGDTYGLGMAGGAITFHAGGSTTSNEKMRLTSNGRLGIGTDAPGDTLTVNGGVQGLGFRCRQGQANPPEPHIFNFNWQGTYIDCFIDSTFVGGIQFLTSDRRLKENIEPLQMSAMDRIKALRPVSFKYKNIPDSIFAERPDLQEGFIADELQAVIPSAVNGAKDGLTKDGQIRPQSLNLAPIVSVLTKAVQEQQQEIEELQAAAKSLAAEKASLTQKLATLEAREQSREDRLSRLESALNATVPRTTRASLDRE